MSKYRAVVFDLFGTIAAGPPAHPVEERLASILGCPRGPFATAWRGDRKTRDLGKKPAAEFIRSACAQAGVQPSPQQMERAVAELTEALRQYLTPLPGATDVLQHLCERGLRLGLVSNCQAGVLSLWPETPFAAFIQSAVFSAAAGLLKPDPRLYVLACEKLWVAPKECLYVGDGGDWELGGAQRAGMSPVLLRRDLGPEPPAYMAEAQEWKGPAIDSLEELLATF